MLKKRFLFLSLALALLLTSVTGAPALAAKPAAFNASGVIDYITPGDVVPAGKFNEDTQDSASGRWRVIERELGGTLSGDIGGPFTFVYKANVEKATQAGNFQGTMTVGDYLVRVNGKSLPIEFAGWYGPYPLYTLTLEGNWTFIDGAKGTGDLVASMTFIPTPDGHIAFIVGSDISMFGQWH